MANARPLRRDARMVVHDDEHTLLKAILCKALGDDAYLRSLVSDDPSESGRVEDRRVLARFFDRMERQFALRDEARPRVTGAYDASARNGAPA